MWERLVLGLAVLSVAACGGDDTSMGVDGSLPQIDGALADAGRADGGPADAGALDAGLTDGGAIDASAADAASADSGARDAGLADAGPDSSMADSGPVTSADGGSCTDPAPPADRTVAVACAACRPVTPEPGGGSGACATHADCTAGVNGRCSLGMIGAFCSYDDCFVDSDCASGQVCSCDGAYFSGANVCVSANCRVSSDCTSGRCSPSYGCLEGGGPEGWYCRTAADTCTADTDCTASLGGRCAYNSIAAHWACAYGICIP